MCLTRINIGKVGKRAKITLEDLKKKKVTPSNKEKKDKKEPCPRCNQCVTPCKNVMNCFHYSMQ